MNLYSAVSFNTDCNSLKILIVDSFSMLIMHSTRFITTIATKIYSIMHAIFF
jgi:hypothetical protein